LWATNAQTHYIQFGDAASGGNYYRGAIGYAHASDTLLLLQSGSTALSFTGSQAATFAGNVTFAGKVITSQVEGSSSLRCNSTAGNLFLDSTSDIILRTTSSNTTALTLDTSQNATFSGNLSVIKSDASTVDAIIRNTHATGLARLIVQSNTDAQNAQLVADDNNGYAWVGSSTGGTNRVVFKQNKDAYYEGGNFGIGTDLPTNGKLEVQQTATTAGLWVQTGGTTDAYTIADFRTGTNASALALKGDGNATFAGIVGMGSTGIYAGTGAQLNLPGRGLAIKNDLNGSSNNWSFIQNTATAGSANLNFHTGSNAAALTLSHLGNATFTGNVGIMTSNIDAPLTVQANGGGSAINIIGRNNGVADESIIGFYQNDGTTRMAYILADEQDLDFATGGSNVRMKITSGGDVAIAMSNYNSGPSASNYGLRLLTGATGKSYWQSAINAATAHFHYEFINTNGSVGKIQTSGSVTIYSTTSDYRLKEDLQDFAGLNMVSKIPVYDFKWKTDKSRSYGVMAHELKEVLPDAVSGNKDAEEMQSVDYSQIVPLLIKSIQELKAEVDLLKQECKCK